MLAERKFLPRLGRPSAERRPSASLRLGPPPFDDASKRAAEKADIDATAEKTLCNNQKLTRGEPLPHTRLSQINAASR